FADALAGLFRGALQKDPEILRPLILGSMNAARALKPRYRIEFLGRAIENLNLAREYKAAHEIANSADSSTLLANKDIGDAQRAYFLNECGNSARYLGHFDEALKYYDRS